MNSIIYSLIFFIFVHLNFIHFHFSNALDTTITVISPANSDPLVCSVLYNKEQNWAEWSECSALCGTGVQVSYLNPSAYLHLPTKNCEVAHRSRQCLGTKCPQDCEVTAWSPYSPCDPLRGIKIRTRNITTPSIYNGTPCPPLQEEIECSVNCEVSDWTDYGQCDQTIGLKNRTRKILQQSLVNGTSCPLLTEHIDCNDTCSSLSWGGYSKCDKNTGLVTSIRPNSNGCPNTKEDVCVVDCEVDAWSSWSTCDPSTGFIHRTRKILYPAKNGGVACGLKERDTDTVQSQPCSVNCQMTKWSEWSECNNNTGIQERFRDIAAYPKNNGSECPAQKEIRDCMVHCEATEWSDWSTCDVKTGYQMRTRDVKISEKNNGLPCTLSENQPCTVDAVVSEWGPWGECIKSGPSKGLRYRSRKVLVDAKNGGTPPDTLTESEVCDIHCEQSNWSEWTECDKKTGLQYSSRLTLIEPINNGAPCEDSTRQRTCPVDCEIDAWSLPSECDQATGFRIRTTQVKVPPLNGGNECPDLVRKEECAVDCQASSWSEPSECFGNNGTRYRTRTALLEAKNGGQNCQLIDYLDCPVNCEVSEWGGYNECFLSGPNAGTQIRHREIIVPSLNGGAACPALSESSECPVDCVVSEWGHYSNCSSLTGLQWRKRQVLIPYLNNGSECPALSDSRDCLPSCQTGNWSEWSPCDKDIGKMFRTREQLDKFNDPSLPCNLREVVDCAVSCETTPWTQLSKCDVGNGTEIQTREIAVEPLNGGASCPPLTQSVPCTVDCVPGEWLPFSTCNPENGTMTRYKSIKIPAKNGGSNSECMISQTQSCQVDCQIDANGQIIVTAKNGGKSCYDLAKEMQLSGDDIDPEKYTFIDTNSSLQNDTISLFSKFVHRFGTNPTTGHYSIFPVILGTVGGVLMMVAVLHKRNRKQNFEYRHIPNSVPLASLRV